MQFVINHNVTETIAVEAETPAEASEKAKRGEGKQMTHNETYNAQPRPERAVASVPNRPAIQPGK